MLKDNFSGQSDAYARFRPVYPPELFEYLYTLSPAHEYAWDCGTGNGQLAAGLAARFKKVYATDSSARQIALAQAADNIEYRVESAEHCAAADHSFDLVTVAQAIHWFNFDAFYKQLRRTLKPGGLLAVIGYGLFQADDDAINQVTHDFYTRVVGPYWDAERRYIDEAYQSIPFPFDEIKAPDFCMKYAWSLDQVMGYISSWSALQHYTKAKGSDPLPQLASTYRKHWGQQELRILTFPLFLRVARV